MIISLRCVYLFNVEHFGALHTNKSEGKIEHVKNSNLINQPKKMFFFELITAELTMLQ